MLLYQDVITGDEMISDAYAIKTIDDIVLEVDCKKIVVKKGADVDIGANPSSEEQDEALDDDSEAVIDIIHYFRLQKTEYDKKSYLTHLKAYMKAVKAKLTETEPDKVEAFEKGAAAYAKKVAANIKNYDFYTGESLNPDGMVVLLDFRDDGITPYVTFWKHGLKEIKL